jgi:hypothetical protein
MLFDKPVLPLQQTQEQGLEIDEWSFTLPLNEKGEPPSCPRISFRTWDFGSQEFNVQFFLTSGSIFIVVFNLWEDREANIQYWLEVIHTSAKGSPILIVGTHLDDRRTGKQKPENILQVIDILVAMAICCSYSLLIGNHQQI